jgi:hypothetical protein
MQECRNTTAPSSSVCSLKAMLPGARASNFASFALRSARGDPRHYSIASFALWRRWSASNTATPSAPATTASPSMVNDLARSLAAAEAIAG